MAQQADGALPSGYHLETLVPPLSAEAQEAVYRLLLQYGPHYPEHFGPDMRARMAAAAGDQGSGLLSVAAWHEDGSVASHACVIFDETSAAEGCVVGLFGAVITAVDHRRRGLSHLCVDALLRAWDARCAAGGSVLVLGTGSPSAARNYQAQGFRHLLGGFDGKKGYNPEDLGEWILARRVAAAASGGAPPGDGTGVPPPPAAAGGLAPYEAAAHFCARDAPAGAFGIERLRRGHWAELCLLLMSFEGGGAPKLAAAGISDGLEAEEALCRLMNRAAAAAGPVAWVARHGASGRVHGVRVLPGNAEQGPEVYAAPGCEGARLALGQVPAEP